MQIGNWADRVCEEKHGFICMKMGDSEPSGDEVEQNLGCKTVSDNYLIKFMITHFCILFKIVTPQNQLPLFCAKMHSQSSYEANLHYAFHGG